MEGHISLGYCSDLHQFEHTTKQIEFSERGKSAAKSDSSCEQRRNVSFRSKLSRAMWHTCQMKKEVCATVSPHAPITSMPGKKGTEEKTFACVSLRDQWVSLPPHGATRKPVAGSCLTLLALQQRAPKTGAFPTKQPFLRLLIVVSQKAGNHSFLSTISISNVSLESWNILEVQESQGLVR